MISRQSWLTLAASRRVSPGAGSSGLPLCPAPSLLRGVSSDPPASREKALPPAPGSAKLLQRDERPGRGPSWLRRSMARHAGLVSPVRDAGVPEPIPAGSRLPEPLVSPQGAELGAERGWAQLPPHPALGLATLPPTPWSQTTAQQIQGAGWSHRPGRKSSSISCHPAPSLPSPSPFPPK